MPIAPDMTLGKCRVYTGAGVIKATGAEIDSAGVWFVRDVEDREGKVIEERVREFRPWPTVWLREGWGAEGDQSKTVRVQVFR